MDKKKILKNQIRKSQPHKKDNGSGSIVGPYNPYQKSQVPGAYLIATAPTVPGGNSKI